MKSEKCSIKEFYRVCMGLTNKDATHPLNWFNIFIENMEGYILPSPLEKGVIEHWHGKTIYCINHPRFNGKIPEEQKTDKGFQGVFIAGNNFRKSKVLFGKKFIPIKYIFICNI